MSVDDHLRAAWQAQRDGQWRLREAMLTLAIGESDPSQGWVGRCRDRLLSERPDHFLSACPTVAGALADPRVVASFTKLRSRYPAAKAQWLRLRSEVIEGPYTGRSTPAAQLLDDLIGPPAEAEVRRDDSETTRGPLSRARINDHHTRPLDTVDDLLADASFDETALLYLGILVQLALLLSIIRSSGRPEPATQPGRVAAR